MFALMHIIGVIQYDIKNIAKASKKIVGLLLSGIDFPFTKIRKHTHIHTHPLVSSVCLTHRPDHCAVHSCVCPGW